MKGKKRQIKPKPHTENIGIKPGIFQDQSGKILSTGHKGSLQVERS